MAGKGGLVALGRDDELARDYGRALVQQLIEGVLAVGARLAPDQRSGVAGDRLARERDALAVRFHVELLQISRQAGEALIVGQDGASREAENVPIPDAEQAELDGDIVFQRRGA